MSPTEILAQVTATRDLTSDIKKITFRYLKPKQVIFQPGHFMIVDINDNQTPPIKRAYSIASNPHRHDKLSFCVKLIEGGRGSTYLCNLKVNDQVKMFGPSGHFLFEPPPNAPILLAGTGTGIAPFIAILHHLVQKEPDRQVRLYFGVRYPEDIFCQKKLANLQRLMPNFSYTIGVSRAEKNCLHRHGRLTQIIAEDGLTDAQNHHAYLCGSQAVVESLREILQKMDIPDSQIHFEKWH